MITIDGSYLEGGGQVVRTALALSALKKEIIEVNNIRHGRPKPGLKAQHLHCIKALQELCDAKVNDVSVGSEYLKFIPGDISGRTISIDIGTAGSITLLLQSLLPPSIFSGKKIRFRIKGGTNVSWSMPVEYLSEVFLPQLSKFADIEFKEEKRGYYPKGGGVVDVKIKPKDVIPKINLVERGKLLQIKGISHASVDLEKANVAERQAKIAKLSLSKLDCQVKIDTEYSDTLSTGSGITLWAIFGSDEVGIDFNNPVKLGADVLGERGKRAETVGEECANKLMQEINSGACVDRHLADNLIPFLALAGGSIKTSEITMHTKTNMWVVEQFVGKCFDVNENVISVNK